MKKVNIVLNGKTIETEAENTILHVAMKQGITIPALCNDPGLKPYNSCWLCLVEVKGARNLVPACSTYVQEGMVVVTENQLIRETRKICLELLLSEHLGDCTGPCQAACPAGCDAQGYVNLIAQGKDREAIILIKETLAMPASLGRVCPRPCESDCRRNRLEGAVSICHLKRFAADRDMQSGNMYLPQTKPATGQKVAVIGAGPGGLSAAYKLAQEGHAVTIFEQHPQAGGMLRYGIPEYRLPKAILDQEVNNILALGIKINYGIKLGKDITLESLKQQGYQAVLLAIGAQLSSGMQAEGESSETILYGTDFLKAIASGEKISVGKKVIVVGGGNTAIDVSRTAVRLGADEVTILYRRTRTEMPANALEIEAAEKEGVQLHFLAAPVKVKRIGAQVELTCIKMQLGAPDASGRRRPEPVKGSEFILLADSVVAAIGQKVDPCGLEKSGLAFTKYGTVKVEPDTFLTNLPGVFAIGDCVTGPDIAVQAVGDGRRAAVVIDNYLKQGSLTGAPRSYNASMGELPEIAEAIFKDVPRQERATAPELEVSNRKDFDEVELGFTEAAARKEAARCLECGCRKAEDCLLRKYAAEYAADPGYLAGAKRPYQIDLSHPEVALETNKCILCGICARTVSEVDRCDVLGFIARGFEAQVKPPFNKSLTGIKYSEYKKLAGLCPTGAFSLKERKYAK